MVAALRKELVAMKEVKECDNCGQTEVELIYCSTCDMTLCSDCLCDHEPECPSE